MIIKHQSFGTYLFANSNRNILPQLINCNWLINTRIPNGEKLTTI